MGSKTIKLSWDLLNENTLGKLTMLNFYIMDGESPLIVGLDVNIFADTMNRGEPAGIIFQSPGDTK